MKIFNTKEIKNIDALTVRYEGITSLELMERAALAAADEIMARWTQKIPVIIFAGKGNNGGDGLAIARILTKFGYDVTTYLFNPSGKLSKDCQKNKEALKETDNAKLIEVNKSLDMPSLDGDILVIDALFGTGLNTPITGGFGILIQNINNSSATVVSIDMPSGFFGEDNLKNDPRNVIKADITLTFQLPKLSFMFAESEKYTGEVIILDIGLSKKAIEEIHTCYYYTERFNAAGLLKSRSRFANKGDFGKALLIAGSYGMMGAAQLSATACLRSGVGVLTVHSPKCGYNIIQSMVPEAKFQADENEMYISEISNPGSFTAIAVGPGISTDDICVTAIENLISELKSPCVIDADALNIIAGNRELLNQIPRQSILTPHIKEFDRIFGESDNEYKRLQKAIEAAKLYNIIIVLKGAHSAVVLPTGNVHFNSTGNPGMATGGSGDVLTGIILAFIAQKYTPSEAAVLATYIHGLAGDIALSITSAESLTASDIIQNLGNAFRQLHFVK